ncbi:hypothetical protein PF007_g27631 [Phytophthora fragariae]|uniref:Uncharacterized protein n=1 Tax=Phytophthora fragariae TaxID=53985 RepID=A0A6A4BHF1_9STRA|nr:hypothetical protein PF003_g32769 [Phytophthora fragariae]KAE8922158.1 hypothetical protein PF009_g27572 [Phytophthora fragariae]KAE9068591.1 hypothetical protein PF007_g27631 [Phytophthora fragariae]KAE9084839.1 hypothetical protein PF006_g26391 [Phytophthora fragariae]KAE9273837.1 hypothetical protein PF001_g27330 [Phytophthora fragariae]
MAIQRSKALTGITQKSPVQYIRDSLADSNEGSPDLAARLDLLEKKLDFLIDKLAHMAYPTCYDESSTTTEDLLVTFDTNAARARTILGKKKESGDWLTLSTQQYFMSS